MMGLSFCVGWAHSLQGDISAIVDSAGNLVVEYKYDAWGNITHMFGSLASTLGEMNPFRYRGYTLREKDAENLAKRFGQPRLDLRDGGKYAHYNVETRGFKDIHFWFFY